MRSEHLELRSLQNARKPIELWNDSVAKIDELAGERRLAIELPDGFDRTRKLGPGERVELINRGDRVLHEVRRMQVDH